MGAKYRGLEWIDLIWLAKTDILIILSYMEEIFALKTTITSPTYLGSCYFFSLLYLLLRIKVNEYVIGSKPT